MNDICQQSQNNFKETGSSGNHQRYGVDAYYFDYLETTLGVLVVPYRSTELTAMASGEPLNVTEVFAAVRIWVVNQFLPYRA